MSVSKRVACGWGGLFGLLTACGTAQVPAAENQGAESSDSTATQESGVASSEAQVTRDETTGASHETSVSTPLHTTNSSRGSESTTTTAREATSNDVDAGLPTSVGPAALSSSVSSSDVTAEPIDPSAEIYDPERVPRFDIEISPGDLDALRMVTGQDDPRQDTYVHADLHYGDETVSNVGLRIKGEGSFQQLDAKPAWKIKFDEFVPDQTFHGLKRLTLNNLFEDPSFVAERLAYDVYRAVGIPAPRCNSALVYVNGEYYGVYANVEAEDKTFLRRWFEDVSGNLYEEGQSDFVPGAETAFNLETNEQTNDRSDLIALIDAVSGATNPTTFLDDVGAYLDANNYLRFTAVEAAVNQWDMYSYTVFWVNNMRLYNDPQTGKFHFIPWGHDLSMKPYRDSGKPYVHLFELARQYDRPNGPVTSGLLLQRCLQSEPCVAAYRTAVREVIEVYAGLNLEAKATAYYDQIKDSVYADERKRVCCDGESLSNADFEAAHGSVLATIRGRVAALEADLEQGP